MDLINPTVFIRAGMLLSGLESMNLDTRDECVHCIELTIDLSNYLQSTGGFVVSRKLIDGKLLEWRERISDNLNADNNWVPSERDRQSLGRCVASVVDAVEAESTTFVVAKFTSSSFTTDHLINAPGGLLSGNTFARLPPIAQSDFRPAPAVSPSDNQLRRLFIFCVLLKNVSAGFSGHTYQGATPAVRGGHSRLTSQGFRPALGPIRSYLLG